MPKILYDVFPCHVAAAPEGMLDDVSKLKSFEPTIGAYYLEITRVIVTEDLVMIAKDGDIGPVLVFKEKYSEFLKSSDVSQDSRIITESGKMLAFKKDTGCGCGSKLRGWNPYKTLNSIND